MDVSLSSIVRSFTGTRVLLIGDSVMDRYIYGAAERVCREAPAPVFRATKRTSSPGGAANTAMNLAALGAEPHFISAVGFDSSGETLVRILQEAGVVTRVFADGASGTTSKTRLVADAHTLVRVDEGGERPLEQSTENEIIAAVADAYKQVDAVIISDYGRRVVSRAVIETIAALRRSNPKPLIVDSRDRLGEFKRLSPTLVKPNFEETIALLREECVHSDRKSFVEERGELLLELTGAEIVAATLDHEGAVIFERDGERYRTGTRPISNSRAVGAGDTYISTFALALAVNAPARVAAELAAKAATVVLEHSGTACCSADELLELLGEGGKHLDSPEHLTRRARSYRRQGKTIAFTNGCFDILHAGTLACLQAAKSMADVLIVGVNSDKSAERIKGPGRPLTPLEDRVKILSALSYVDHVIPFEEDTACNLIEALAPDVFVKGGNHSRAALPEVPVVERLGGRVVMLPRVKERSTSGFIERVRQRLDHVKGRVELEPALFPRPAYQER